MYTLSVYVAYLSVAMLLANSQTEPGLAPNNVHAHWAEPIVLSGSEVQRSETEIRPIAVKHWTQLQQLVEKLETASENRNLARPASKAPTAEDSETLNGVNRPVMDPFSTGLDSHGKAHDANATREPTT